MKNDILDMINESSTLREVADFIRLAMIVEPDLRGVKFYNVDHGLCMKILSDDDSLKWPELIEALEQVDAVIDDVYENGSVTITHRASIGYFMGFAKELLEFNGVPYVVVDGIGSDLQVLVGRPYDGKDDARSQKLEGFFRYFFKRYPYLDYTKIRSWDSRTNGIKIALPKRFQED